MTFTEWLKSQKDRKGDVGDLARAAADDAQGPRVDARYAHWREHLEDQQAPAAALRALAEAWREYSALP
jgi:uncharacterized protein YozE (UPF0346 family)